MHCLEHPEVGSRGYSYIKDLSQQITHPRIKVVTARDFVASLAVLLRPIEKCCETETSVFDL